MITGKLQRIASGRALSNFAAASLAIRDCCVEVKLVFSFTSPALARMGAVRKVGVDQNMSVQLLVLRGVPEDEVEEIRELLRDARVQFYETPEGNWGVSMPAIWLNDADDCERAQALLNSYQTERARQARDDYSRSAEGGRIAGVVQRLRREPLRVVSYLAIVVLVLYFSTMPFLSLGSP